MSYEDKLPELKAVAEDFLGQPLYSWSGADAETEALKPFFTNLHGKVFFMHNLPQAIGDALLAMYSRMKNPRGIRGMFVDSFLPQLLATQLSETEERYDGDPASFIKANGIKNLASFARHSPESARELHRFLSFFSSSYLQELVIASSASGNSWDLPQILEDVKTDKDYLRRLCSSEKVRKFISMWLDKYGHNSIARMVGGIWLCVEEISTHTAKSLEWSRPGAGFIELSTRYVDMSRKGAYPVWEEVGILGGDRQRVKSSVEMGFDLYRALEGEKLNGPLPSFLRERWRGVVAEENLEAGVFGETCDVLGNLLPVATLTSVGMAISGEAFPGLVRHLILENTPETLVLADMIIKESEALGYDQFLRHTEPTAWQTAHWEYLHADYMPHSRHDPRGIVHADFPPARYVEDALYQTFSLQPFFADCQNFGEVLVRMGELERGKFDKLPNHFEHVSGSFTGYASFRSWRDLHRQGFSTHYRTLITPLLGFYAYDKPAPKELNETFRRLHEENLAIWALLSKRDVPKRIRQYAMALGSIVGFTFGANLLQLEFCGWQRSKPDVNHEVRQIFLGMERVLRRKFRWWERVSRADTTPAYVFARTAKEGGHVPLPPRS